jgi:hypothetical protein
VVERVVAASRLAPAIVGTPTVRVTDDGIEVEISVYADYIFASVVPGSPDRRPRPTSCTPATRASPSRGGAGRSPRSPAWGPRWPARWPTCAPSPRPADDLDDIEVGDLTVYDRTLGVA